MLVVAGALAWRTIFFRFSSVEPRMNLDLVPDLYTAENVETGEQYPIVGRDEHDMKIVLQEFKVMDVSGEYFHISVYQAGDAEQGRPYMQGWVKQINSNAWIRSETLKVRPG